MLELDRTLLPGPLKGSRALAVSPNGLLLACATHDDELVIWDLASRVVLARHEAIGTSPLCWSSDETVLLGQWGGVDVRHALSGEMVSQWEGADIGFVNELIQWDEATTIVAGSNRIVFLRENSVVDELGPWPDVDEWDHPHHVDVHPDGDTIALAFDDGARVVNRSGEELARFEGALRLRFGPDGESLLAMSWSEAMLYDWPRLSSARPLAMSPTDARVTQGRWLVWDHQTAGLFERDGTEVWATRYYDGLETVAVHGTRFYTTSRWLGVRDVGSGELLNLLPSGGGESIHAIAFDEQGGLVIAADHAGRVTVWDFERAEAHATIDTSSLQDVDAALEVAAMGSAERIWVSDGELNVVAGPRYVWPDVTSPELATTSPREEVGTFLAYSDDARFAVLKDYEHEAAFLIRTEDGAQVAMLPPHRSFDERIIIEPGGRRLLFNDVSGEGTTLRLWNVEQSSFEHELHIDQPADLVTFAPDGSIVGWVSTHMVFDWDRADEDLDEAPNVYFRWEPETADVVRWIDPPAELRSPFAVLFAADETVFAECAPTMLLTSGEFQPLTRGVSTRAAVHEPTGRMAIAMERGVIALIDRRAGTEVLVCTTADGSTWSFRENGDFQLNPSTWVTR